MREIKFKAKQAFGTEAGRWLFGSVLWMTSPDAIEEGYVAEIMIDAGVMIYVDPETVSQFTGLKDKNGADIYEGDIVNCTEGCPHTVIWTEINNQNLGSVPGWYLSGLKNPGYSFTGKEEVIGSIHPVHQPQVRG